ncbi:hypothetical protein [Ralstonia sp. SET104]|uniref:hypothetical protein n=1 Tax=Ralstonia sp. SET104 TaxID=2448774 RepID=UPI000F57881A|nr:hypothetical protein [Ralstonia sp. SET104]GCB06729.1 hypothetical protein PSUB009319_43600 [Ralstonia sp. SET104]
MTQQIMRDYAKLDRRSVHAQLQGHGDGRHEFYELFLQVAGIESGLVEIDGTVVDMYATAMQGRTYSLVFARALICLGRMLHMLELVEQKLDRFAGKYGVGLPAFDGLHRRGNRNGCVNRRSGDTSVELNRTVSRQQTDVG